MGYGRQALSVCSECERSIAATRSNAASSAGTAAEPGCRFCIWGGNGNPGSFLSFRIAGLQTSCARRFRENSLTRHDHNQHPRDLSTSRPSRWAKSIFHMRCAQDDRSKQFGCGKRSQTLRMTRVRFCPFKLRNEVRNKHTVTYSAAGEGAPLSPW